MPDVRNGERDALIVEQCKTLSKAAVARAHGISAERVSQIVRRAEREAQRRPHWADGLSSKARYAIFDGLDHSDFGKGVEAQEIAHRICAYMEGYWLSRTDQKTFNELVTYCIRNGHSMFDPQWSESKST